ncbi:centrosomal protein of 135 kDa-like isoform X2 [Mercenaria mercenaria]|uniref:centrosomal protein of 135 kDa-like isoform X2 n=1 Tax=Mercenaria mercenaria TaxID=6596 RepID=UPI00234FB54F|nr:centrosomal protein of 135 kDa-like isoform X2 [Mercenaria mercenaria]
MSGTATAQAQQKFSNLRKRLDQLGYKQPLGIESLPLVEKLFADLVHTTESLKNAKLEIGQQTTETKDLDSAIEPYKSDNAKLVKENNDLHKQLIKQKEESDAVFRELKASLRKLEHENADLKFLNNQYVHKVRGLEKESKEKSDRILNLQEKNFHAVVSTPGGKKKTIPFRRQRMEIDCTVPPADDYQRSKPNLADDPYVADLLQVADSRIAELERQASELSDKNEIADRKMASFRQQVEGRDEEIERLHRMLDGGRPSDVVALEARNRANERMISHLNIQIDFLQQKNREMDRKYRDAVTDRSEVESDLAKYKARMSDLELEFQSVDRHAKRLETDKSIVLKTADREMEEAKGELEKSRHEMEDLDVEIAQLRAENARLTKEFTETRSSLMTKTSDLMRLEELHDRVSEDKKRLSHRVNKLMANEKELVLEIERLKRKNGPAGAAKKGKIPSKLDAFVRSIEEERNYYRDQAEAFQKMLRGEIPSRSRSPPRSRTPSRPSSRSASPARELNASAKADKKAAAQYEAIMRVLEEERDYYKGEYEILKATKRASSARATPTKDSENKLKKFGMTEDVEKLTRERDEMRQLLDKFERHMAEIQANVKVLTGERDKLNKMYEETKDELHKVRRELVRSPKSPKTSLAAQAVLRRVENERDDAVSELRRMTTERDSLRERLKIATEISLSEKAKLEQRGEDLESALTQAENERGELIVRVNSLKEDVRSLEEQVKDMAGRLTDTQDENSQNKSKATQMKMLAEETERGLEDTQKRLARRESELAAQEERCARLEDRIAELQRTLAHSTDENSDIRRTVSQLDREKDNLQINVDEKTEKIANLNEEVLLKEKLISDLKVRISEIEAQLGHANGNINMKDRELKSLKRQLDSTSEDLNENSRGKEVALRENRRLQDDLAVMTRENQKINQELQEALEDKEGLKQQVQQYILEVRSIEDVLASKEKERSDLLDQYRALSSEAEQYQTATHQLESEGSNMRLEIMTKDSELRRLRDKVDNYEREIQEHLSAQQAYELQVSNLTRCVANLEDNLRQTDDDKNTLLSDLTAVRELCSRLEGTKESLQRQLTALTIDKEQLQSQSEDIAQECELYRSQLTSERQSNKNLEGLLQNNREKEFQSQLQTQEHSAEIQMLKDRLSLNESKIQSQSREIASLRTRNVELEGDVERLRRQLTSEKFESARSAVTSQAGRSVTIFSFENYGMQERAVQELRRHGLVPPVPTMDYTSSTRYRSTSPVRSPRSRSRSPTRFRSRSPETSYLSSSRRRSPDRSGYSLDDPDTATKSYNSDLL